MRGLFLSLPPFSPDYSGVCSALLEMGALLVVHDGTGCSGNFLCHDEPRAQSFPMMVYTSNLREMEVVMGDDEAFLEKVQRAAVDLDPRMIVLLNSPAPLVIGTDFRALSRILEKRTGKPVLFFDTNGIRFYDWGVEQALLAAARRFAAKLAEERAPGGLAVLGAVPLNLGRTENGALLRRELERTTGLETTVVGMGSGENSLGAAARAKVNLVASAAAVPAAEWCRKEFGVPWVADLPVGESGLSRVAEKVRAAADGRPLPQCSVGKAGGRRALVIHEQVAANAFRACLQREFGYGRVDVATFFTLRPELAASGDFPLSEELDFAAAVKAGRYEDVFCDHLLHGMLRGCGARLIDLPHLAVSALMCCPMDFCPVGEAASGYLRERLHEV